MIAATPWDRDSSSSSAGGDDNNHDPTLLLDAAFGNANIGALTVTRHSSMAQDIAGPATAAFVRHSFSGRGDDGARNIFLHWV